MDETEQKSSIARFRELHETGCFVIPNPWDAGTARCLESIGFKALATTSAAVSFSQGRPDEVGALSVDDVLANATEIICSTTLPVSVDFQHGYAREPQDVATNVIRCLNTGAAGFSIEDASGEPDEPLYARALAVERIRAVREYLDNSGSKAIVTARCEAMLVGEAVPLRTVLDRLVAYADAGADCLLAPGIVDRDSIVQLVRAVSPLPLNVLMSRPVAGLDIRQLADMGVRRVSVGSALNRVAWLAFRESAKNILATGNFESLDTAMAFNELNELFS